MANQGDVRKVDNEIARKAEKPPSNFQDVMDAKTRAKEDKAIADNKKDMGERFGRGGATQQRINKQDTKHGKLDLPVANLNRMAGMKGGGFVKESKAMVGKEMMFMKKKGAPASMIKHEKKEMGMKHGGMMKYAEGGKMPMVEKDGKKVPSFAVDGVGEMNMGGMAGMKKMNMGGMSKYAKGGGIEARGKTKGTMIRMATGGSVSSASRRADGIAQRGKTKLTNY
jgi:hypothetical protein